jgi:hypothetical protein
MRFVSFSNKKKLRQKDSNPESRAFGLTQQQEKRVKICHFFGDLRTFGQSGGQPP